MLIYGVPLIFIVIAVFFAVILLLILVNERIAYLHKHPFPKDYAEWKAQRYGQPPAEPTYEEQEKVRWWNDGV